MNNDALVLEEYVHAFFLKRGRVEWPTLRNAARAKRWTMQRVEDAINDSAVLDTQSYYCEPEEPRWAHEIYSTADLGKQRDPHTGCEPGCTCAEG